MVATIIFCFPGSFFIPPLLAPFDMPACGISAMAILANRALESGCDLGRLTLGGLTLGVREAGRLVCE